jgi:two-component system sensor histidine kinase BaeS
VALQDDRGRVVIGNPAVPLDSPSVPIKIDGRLVGNLLLAPQPALNSDIDVAFVRSQAQHALSAAVAILLVALAAALLLARWLLAPVKTLGERMEQLAAGNFAERIESKRSDELGELARNYNRLADTLAKNQDARRQWGADIAHELRTPLSILRGEIQALQDGVRPMSKEALDSLQAECARLTALVDDLYQLALSDAGALSYRFETIEINALIRETEADFARSFQDAGLVLTTTLAATPLTVRADGQRLSQLLSNLLVNCQRYTDAPGNVRISTSLRREGTGGWVDVVIDDSPPGVRAELMPKLFDRLFRVESSRNRAAGGAGLGLAICKNIAEAHGGTIAATASPLGGVRMTLSLPMMSGAAT